MREIRFRAWDAIERKMWNPTIRPDGRLMAPNQLGGFVTFDDPQDPVMQYTGLKDKNGVVEVYEDDIIDETGLIVGNIYEMDKSEADFVIQGFGTKAWCETYSRAILLGCKDAQ